MSDSFKPPNQVFDTGAAKYEASTGSCTYELARTMLSLIPILPSGSVIHDNACGPAIVAQEIVSSCLLTTPAPTPDFSLTIHCTDKSPSMISLAQSLMLARQSMQDAQTAFPKLKIDFASMQSENLLFPDEYFTHLLTNCGILWFDDGPSGAKEIFRTLKRSGTAVVISWKSLGQFDVVREAQAACQHAEPLFGPPVDEKWFSKPYLENVLRDAGFEEVRVVERTVNFAAKSVEELCGHLMGLMSVSSSGWGGEEERHFREQLEVAAKRAVVSVERLGSGNGVEKCVGIPPVALVGVAKR
ncbi:S-adenosyl-L-methionine-dependent methyltransferase [Lizonia empirigonia]|nr:S-adenosyl-L-methionine-dependent methyltransferase [Lizonia empirigonia]